MAYHYLPDGVFRGYFPLQQETSSPERHPDEEVKNQKELTSVLRKPISASEERKRQEVHGKKEMDSERVYKKELVKLRGESERKDEWKQIQGKESVFPESSQRKRKFSKESIEWDEPSTATRFLPAAQERKVTPVKERLTKRKLSEDPKRYAKHLRTRASELVDKMAEMEREDERKETQERTRVSPGSSQRNGKFPKDPVGKTQQSTPTRFLPPSQKRKVTPLKKKLIKRKLSEEPEKYTQSPTESVAELVDKGAEIERKDERKKTQGRERVFPESSKGSGKFPKKPDERDEPSTPTRFLPPTQEKVTPVSKSLMKRKLPEEPEKYIKPITEKRKDERKETQGRITKFPESSQKNGKFPKKPDERAEPSTPRRFLPTTKERKVTQVKQNIRGKKVHEELEKYTKPLTQGEPEFIDKRAKTDMKPGAAATEETDRSTKIEIPEEDEELLEIQFKEPTFNGYSKRKRGFGKFLSCISPCIAEIIYSKRIQYRGLKAMLGFPIGALFGYAVYKLVVERLVLNPFHSRILGYILTLYFGVGYAMSTQVRCICFLTIPSICGRTGRAFINTFVITFVITGPISNIVLNAQESARVLSCVASLNLNHTVERFQLMFKPVKEIVLDFVGAGQKVQDDTKRLEGAFEEIEKEVRDEEEVKEAVAETKEFDNEIGGESRVDVVKKKFSKVRNKFGGESERNYGMKSEFRCEGIFTKGVKGCYDSFGKTYDRCLSYLPIIGYLLCWPMKLTFICDLAGSFMGKRACDSAIALSPGFGESVETAEGVQREFDKDFAVSLQYKLEIPVEQVEQITPQDVSQAMEYEFLKRKRNLDFFMNLISRILALMFIQVFQVSRKYCDRYLRVIQFDNKYITSYFRHIDARRRKMGKKTLLPLKKGEKLELLNPFTVKFSAEEKVTLVLNTVRMIGELITVSIIVMFDWVFYEFLMLIQRHAHITYKQTGIHHIQMTIYGDGFIGNMVRSILKGFNKKHSTDMVTSTGACLPLPVKLDSKRIIELYLIFLLMFILMIIESYALRLRRIICSFFYPKREKKRILFLYNDRLKKRRSFMQHMRHRIRKMARNQAIALDTGVFYSLRHLYPKYVGWLGKIGFGKKCLVCEEIESQKTPFDLHSDDCPFVYCPECWSDMKGRCFVCEPDEESDLTDDEVETEW